MGWRGAGGAAGRGLLRLLLRATPALHHAVVAGFPFDEGNSVETVRALARRMPVYWLVGDTRDPVDWLLHDADPQHPVRRLRKNSVHAFLAYITARYAFFTHGLYGSPDPPPHKTIVNLWHGDGPKRSKRYADIRSTFVVAGTQLWGSQRSAYFGVDADGVLVTGNPRIDQFARPPGDDTMRALGLDPQRPLVLWMPTFRRTDYQGNRLGSTWDRTDGQELSQSESEAELLPRVGQLARQLGITLAVKPHPIDADTYQATGLSVLHGDELRRAHTTVYQLLGRTHGLITDYSSVWTDYLVMDRPVGFHCPDLAEYEADPGLNVDGYRELIPGPLLDTFDDFERFLRECLEESVESRQRRARTARLIGAETRLGASDRLLDAIATQESDQPGSGPPTARPSRRRGRT